jgi:hypothetical protein
MTQNNELLDRIMGNPTPSSSPTSSSASSNPFDEAPIVAPVDDLLPQTRIVTVRYKVYSAIIVVLLAILFISWLPQMQDTFTATHSVYDQTQQQLQDLAKQKIIAQEDERYLHEIETNQTTLENCLNNEDGEACATLPVARNVEYKGKTIKDFSIPLSYLQLNSLYTPKMPVDEKKVLRNLNEYLIRDGVVQGVSVKNGDITRIAIGDVSAVGGSSVFFSVPIDLSIKFERVRDLISFVRNVEKKLISIPEDRILYKVKEVGYDIVASDQPQTTDISMTAYYYHDPRFQNVSEVPGVPDIAEEGVAEVDTGTAF